MLHNSTPLTRNLNLKLTLPQPLNRSPLSVFRLRCEWARKETAPPYIFVLRAFYYGAGWGPYIYYGMT